jgi:hypothetical protein
MRARFYLTENYEDEVSEARDGCKRARKLSLAGEFAEEFPLVHAVLEGFAAVDENDGDFIVKLAADFVIGINVDFTPGEAATAGELDQAFLDDFAEMASLAGVNHDLAGVWHGRDFSVSAVQFPA